MPRAARFHPATTRQRRNRGRLLLVGNLAAEVGVLDEADVGAVGGDDSADHDSLADVIGVLLQRGTLFERLVDRRANVLDTPVRVSVATLVTRNQSELVARYVKAHVELFTEVRLKAQEGRPPRRRRGEVLRGVDDGAKSKEGCHGRMVVGRAVDVAGRRRVLTPPWPPFRPDVQGIEPADRVRTATLRSPHAPDRPARDDSIRRDGQHPRATVAGGTVTRNRCPSRLAAFA